MTKDQLIYTFAGVFIQGATMTDPYENIERIIINDVMPESRDVMFCLLDVARAADYADHCFRDSLPMLDAHMDLWQALTALREYCDE